MSKFYYSVLIGVCFALNSATVYSIDMTPQIQQLLIEKQNKITELEKCEGKKQGWMIAGISTIGLTVVGVGVNIAQASKSDQLTTQIKDGKNQLKAIGEELDSVNNQIQEKTMDNQSNKLYPTQQPKFVSSKKDQVQTNPVVKEKSVYSQLNSDMNGTGKCYHLALDNLPTVEETITNDKIKFECGDLSPGEWIVEFSNDTTVRGTSFISKTIPAYDAGNGTIPDETIQSKVTNEYLDWQQNGYAASDDVKNYACYCKMTDPKPGKWVFSTRGTWGALKDNCASTCAREVKDMPLFRKSVFTY